MKEEPEMNIIKICLTLFLAIIISACGGGATPNTTTSPPPSGGGTNTSTPAGMFIIGTITGFGSVYINGIKYEVDTNTVVSVEGEVDVMGDDSNLAVGMKVQVRATLDNDVRTATSIEFDEDLKGTIESVTPDSSNSTTGQIVVLGQVVFINDNTVFDNDIGNNDSNPAIDFRDLQLNMAVEVSGYAQDGGFLASRIDRLVDDNGIDLRLGDPDTDDDELELKGTVEAVADDFSTITVNGIVFIVSTNTFLDNGLIIDANLVGAYVEVSADIINADYVARKIELEDLFSDDDMESEIEIEGILQAIDNSTSPETITINGINIPIDNSSTFEGLIGKKIEVKGNFNDAGVLIVSSIKQEQEQSLKTEDVITNINIAESNFTTRLGLTITPDSNSRLEDDSAESDDHLSPDQFLTNLMTGDFVKAGAVENSDGSLTWVRVKRTELANEVTDASCELTGLVSAINGDANDFTIVIGEITIQTSQTENHEFTDANEIILGRTTFFNRLQTGILVKAESFEGDAYCTEGMLDAEKMELSDVNND